MLAFERNLKHNFTFLDLQQKKIDILYESSHTYSNRAFSFKRIQNIMSLI